MDRLLNLKKIIDWALGFKGIELIVVEQDSVEKLQAYSLRGFKHIFIKSELPYNRSWSFNVGLKYCSTNAIAFSDPDVIMDPMEFIESVKKLNDYECVNPSKSLIALSQQENAYPIDALKKISRDSNPVPMCSGIIVFRRPAIDKIGGWCEDFIGKGGEDEYQTIKVLEYLTYIEIDNRSYRLNSHEEKSKEYNNVRNSQLLESFKSMSKENMTKHINNNRHKIGSMNRFVDK